MVFFTCFSRLTHSFLVLVDIISMKVRLFRIEILLLMLSQGIQGLMFLPLFIGGFVACLINIFYFNPK